MRALRPQDLLAGGAVPVLLLAIGLLQVIGGTAWTPEWLINLLARSGFPAIQSTQLCSGVLIGAAAALFLLAGTGTWSVRLARGACMAIAFAAVAEGAAILAKPPVAGQLQGASALLWTAIALAASLGLLIAIDRAGKTGAGTFSAKPFHALPTLTGRRVAAAIVAFLIAIGVTGRLSIKDTIRTEQLAGQGFEPIELDTANWVGQTIPGTGIAKHVPLLTAETMEDDAIIVFFNPHCSACHQLFLEHLNADRPEKIIAVEVPPAKAQETAAGDGHDDIDCPHCTRHALPAGPMWLVEIPTVVRVENGVVTCVATKDFEKCLTPAESTQPTEPTQPTAAN